MPASEALSVGQKLVELVKADKSDEALKTLYSKDIVSVEAGGDASMPATIVGMDALLKKHEWWYANHETHGGDVQGPFPHGDRFILLYTMDITAKAGSMAGQRMTFTEAALYTVAGGKIVKEEYFYVT